MPLSPSAQITMMSLTPLFFRLFSMLCLYCQLSVSPISMLSTSFIPSLFTPNTIYATLHGRTEFTPKLNNTNQTMPSLRGKCYRNGQRSFSSEKSVARNGWAVWLLCAFSSHIQSWFLIWILLNTFELGSNPDSGKSFLNSFSLSMLYLTVFCLFQYNTKNTITIVTDKRTAVSVLIIFCGSKIKLCTMYNLYNFNKY